MLFLKASLVMVLMAITFVLADDCPGYMFRCPSGEAFTVNTCWSSLRLKCEPCRSITAEMKSRCPKYSCSGSVDNWYAQSNGCNIPNLNGVMSLAFRDACEIHDICYGTPGMTKRHCDNTQFWNMHQTCFFSSRETALNHSCMAAAVASFRTVTAAGGPSFNTDFASTCRRV